jgi:5-methylcytosine-specific restriction endonuclease McrA
MLQRTSQQRRRARRATAPIVESFSRADIDRIFAETGGRCAYCCRDKRKLTLDHIIPLFGGGEHSDLNLIGACLSCNSSKHVGLRSPKLWRSERQRVFIQTEFLRRR